MTDEPGVYQLRLRLPEPARIQVGKLGVFDFPAGIYVYTGSALGGLGKRLARHWGRRRKRHWHIDYLLDCAQIKSIAVHPTRERLECAMHRRTLEQPGARVVAPGFGSSDCRCQTHLVYLGPAEEA